MGGQTYEPVHGSWFMVHGSRTARRSARPVFERAGICPPGVRACPDLPARRSVVIPSRRTVLGCNRQTSLCPRFLKTRRTSSRLLSAIRAPWQRVSAHRARLVVACYRLPRRIRWIPARACLSSGITYNGTRFLDTDSVNDSNDLSRSIRESGPRGGGAMASALFRENNPVKNDMA